jgi:hypothetical protein
MSMLRKATFERVLDKVHLEFGFDPLTPSKKRKYTDARALIYYVCRRKKRIRLDDLLLMLDEKGYKTSRANVIRQVDKIHHLVREDFMMKNLINEIAE